MTAPAVVCGRCGAKNPGDAEFCQSCGAFMAAYQAPAGATVTIEALTHPAEATPATETIYNPPSPPNAEIEHLQFKAKAASKDIPAVPAEVVEPIQSAPAAVAEPSQIAVPSEQPRQTSQVTASAPPTHHPVQSGTYSYASSPRPKPPELVEELPPPPPIFQKVFGEYADDVYYSGRVNGSRVARGSPQSFILGGIAALIFVCVAASIASSNGWLFLLIGGPLACSLIAIGVLLLVGRYPTGRP